MGGEIYLYGFGNVTRRDLFPSERSKLFKQSTKTDVEMLSVDKVLFMCRISFKSIIISNTTTTIEYIYKRHISDEVSIIHPMNKGSTP